MANFKKQSKEILYAGSFYGDVTLNETERVDFVSGAALFIRGEFVKTHGLFDSDFFIYNDEMELGYRMKKAGFDYYVTEKAKIWHNHDWSKKNISGYKFMYYYMMRNRVLYFRKFKLYPQLLLDLFLQVITWSFTLKMFNKIGSISIIKYYYLGLLRGLLGEKSITKIKFE